MTTVYRSGAEVTLRGIPTAHNVDHYAFTVPDLNTAIVFFVDLLGAELCYRLNGVNDPGGTG